MLFVFLLLLVIMVVIFLLVVVNWSRNELLMGFSFCFINLIGWPRYLVGILIYGDHVKLSRIAWACLDIVKYIHSNIIYLFIKKCWAIESTSGA